MPIQLPNDAPIRPPDSLRVLPPGDGSPLVFCHLLSVAGRFRFDDADEFEGARNLIRQCRQGQQMLESPKRASREAPLEDPPEETGVPQPDSYGGAAGGMGSLSPRRESRPYSAGGGASTRAAAAIRARPVSPPAPSAADQGHPNPPKRHTASDVAAVSNTMATALRLGLGFPVLR